MNSSKDPIFNNFRVLKNASHLNPLRKIKSQKHNQLCLDFLKINYEIRNLSNTKKQQNLLIILKTNVSWTRNQHDSNIFQFSFHDMHKLIKVARRWFCGICQKSIIKVNTKCLWLIMIPKRQATLN